MFQLIVAVISIALVAVLAIASTFYGGTAFTLSNHKAQITALINAGEEIAAANTLYFTDWGAPAAGVSNLISGGAYLASMPIDSTASQSAWDSDGIDTFVELKYTGSPLISFCHDVATQAGLVGTFFGSAADLPSGVPFGCVGSVTNAKFHFRL